MFSLGSPHQGDSNEYTQYTIFNIKKKITLNYPKSEAVGFCSKGLKNKFEIAMVNKPSVIEPLKFCCIKGALVAQWVRRWPTDLADQVGSSLEMKSSQP